MKDISGKEIHMTHYEKKALMGIIKSQYRDPDIHPENYPIYTWDAIDNSGLSSESVAGVWSSLVKKGWIEISGGFTTALQGLVDDMRETWLTDEGYKAITQTEEGRKAMIEEGHIEEAK